ncbi:hypothetical protein SISNIDRAFT_449024 [Sistotremastrum niveocremeum HHB9708]|uniref:Topoisomerase I damage affected protein 2 n=2 Tax=Sistotremastraceae TaxID=3402574 RepID=A0A164Z3R2_9AGAM|nr:hypothetical protein SISNIDRAFT_449024 [Sistotremastrum niveocremeum HHB9708]KZT38974.1 hypothetical protein SISSUDRAFT_1046298 [Sistotremastrum suecicum HHB10207 ss-3]
MSGLRSPASRSSAPSPRPTFDADLLRAYTKKLLQSTLGHATWPDGSRPEDKDRTKAWCKEIGERVKQRMLEISPRGFKYIVTTQISENLGQGARADLKCHWEDTDVVVQEVFSNDHLICICLAFAVRTT